MKKAFRGIATVWCLVCGLVVPPAVLAVVIARSLGALDLDPLVARIEGRTPAASGDVAGAGLARATAAIPPGDLATPIEALAWRRRLEALGAEVGADARALADRENEVAGREAAQTELAASLAGLVGEILGEPVDPAALLADPVALRDRLAARRDAEQLRPRLLALVKSVENEALASMITAPTASNGLDEDTVTRLMEDLPPSRAGEVLTELGLRDPALAARILARLERRAGPPGSDGEPPR